MNEYILYAEINVICILILVLISIKVVRSMFIQEQRRLFLKVAISNIIFVSLDLLWILVNNHPNNSMPIVVWTIDVAYYVASGLVGWFWFWYSETVQESKFALNRRSRISAEVPFVILVFFILISFKTGWLFYIDEYNSFHRGPAYSIVLILAYGYVIFTAVKSYINSMTAPDFHRKQELLTLFRFVLPTIVTGVLQIFMGSYPVICVGNTFGVLYVYLTLQEQLILLDPLTKLNNRNQLMQTLSLKPTHIHSDNDLYLLIMDIDYFKSINDKYGHIEGDHALKLVADALLKVSTEYNCTAYRFGGDEFVILYEAEKHGNVDEISNRIHQLIREIDTPYKLSLSIGYTSYTSEIKSQQDFIDKADQQLYMVKENRTQAKVV